MDKVINRADVILWGLKVATIHWHENQGYFEYSKEFQHSGIELSPLKMPLSAKSYSFTELSLETFKGLPGMLADSLPDKFGMKLIDQWLEIQGRAITSFSPVERLCYIGERGMGALEFRPTVGIKKEKSFHLQVDELVLLANDALSEKGSLETSLGGLDKEKQKAVEHIISVGTSAGGARAKAVIAWNEKTNEIRSGQIKADEGFSYWLLKFDGVSENKDKEMLADPVGFGVVEYAYYLMAKTCGIEMSKCRLLTENGRSHFMTKRFDRLSGGEKLHMQSLCGLAHYDFNESGAYSYEQVIGLMRQLGLSQSQINQFYLRMLFNIVAVNQDDHTKNIAFLMNQQGQWSLSPAYDITYCNGAKWTSKHQMTINGKTANFKQSDLIDVALHADISKTKALKMLAKVVNVVGRWQEFVNESGLNECAKMLPELKKLIDQIAGDHRLYLLD
ncbi:MAG: type II toxin-antitoxin system HipA family toxin [Colwellia sp.]|nr:type II toxin-antitoxin system HipA family toxin [Colwellia sp.]